MLYSQELLIERVKQLNDFKEIPENYWIIGIRNSEDKPDTFDDIFYLMKGDQEVLYTSGTTHSGVAVLQGGYKKYNNQGAAVLESDRIYYNVWKYGMHQGKVPALKQLGNSVTIWRDGDGDKYAEEQGVKTTGYYGINFHSDQHDLSRDYRADDKAVGWWSAGCQVCNKIEDYNKIIALCKTQKAVTYCLLKEFSV